MGLESVELVIEWERKFSISISNELASQLLTPKLAADAIERILLEEGRPLEKVAIEGIIKETTLEISGMSRADYDPSLQFVRDFGLD